MKKIALTLLLTLGLFASTMHTAKILENKSSGGYTYMKVQDGSKSYWIAMTQRDVKSGDTISFVEQGWMKNFHSKTLNHTFDNILFAADVQQNKQLQAQNIKPDIMDSKYAQKGTTSIAKLFKYRAKYADTTVTVRGKVTKVSEDIMGLNWIHIEDGSIFSNMDDLVFTSKSNPPKVGDVVYAKGVAVKDKDFGYGYFYPLIIQKSTFKNKI
jgi:hypothetical protein